MTDSNISRQVPNSQESHQRYAHYVYTPVEISALVRQKIIGRAHAYLLSEINGHVDPNGLGCWASNAYLAELCGCTAREIQREVAKLRELGLIIDSDVKKVIRGEECRTIETPWSRVKIPQSGQGHKFQATTFTSSPPRRLRHPSIKEEKEEATVARSARRRVAVSSEHDQWDTSIARRIWMLTNKRGTARQFRSDTWVPPITSLRTRLKDDKERIERVLAWYEKHWKGHWLKITHAKGFSKNFLDYLEPDARKSPNSPDDKPHKDTDVVLEKLSHLKWPTVARDKLPRAISIGLKNLERLTNAFRAAPPEVRREFKVLIQAINYAIGRDTTFVAEFYEKVHRQKAGWKDWNGHLPELTFKVGKGELDLVCRSVATETCRDEDRWNKLMEKIDL
jgi:hypothetical protein